MSENFSYLPRSRAACCLAGKGLHKRSCQWQTRDAACSTALRSRRDNVEEKGKTSASPWCSWKCSNGPPSETSWSCSSKFDSEARKPEPTPFTSASTFTSSRLLAHPNATPLAGAGGSGALVGSAMGVESGTAAMGLSSSAACGIGTQTQI